ncbi:MAG TPA: starch-binding protein, partial [Flavobacterium sp.]|nr:starch-binding protein [Flavobacterium sp.]
TLKAFVKNVAGVSSAVKTETYNFSAATTLTVYFKPPTSWTSAPKLHYWNAVPSGSVANTTWPGVTMVPDTNGFYKYTITGPTSVNIIFNNGSSGSANQTPDLLNKTNGYSYTWGVTTAKMDAKPEVKAEEETYLIRLYPNPVNETLQISSTSPINNYTIISAQGKTVQEGKVNENTIDVSRLSVGLYFIVIRLENGQETMQKIMKK